MKLTAIYGPMCSGKTSALAYRYHKKEGPRAFFTHTTDTRWEYGTVTHDGFQIVSKKAHSAMDLLEQLHGFTGALYVDELQFFDEGIVQTLTLLLARCDIVVAGLDLDYLRKPFGHTMAVEAMAHKAIRLTADCAVEGCKHPARYTSRIVDADAGVLVGGLDLYAPRCHKHHT